MRLGGLADKGTGLAVVTLAGFALAACGSTRTIITVKSHTTTQTITHAVTPTDAGSPTLTCAGGFNPGGTRGSFFRDIRERNTSCAHALAVTRGYVVRLNGVAGSIDQNAVRVGAYVCATVVTVDADAVFCSDGNRQVTFFGSP